MNERIRLLYEQAHLVREYPADDTMRGGSPPTVYWGGETSAEKFAESIVKECVKKCRTDWYGDSLDDICIQMLEHFGVE